MLHGRDGESVVLMACLMLQEPTGMMVGARRQLRGRSVNAFHRFTKHMSHVMHAACCMQVLALWSSHN